MADNAEAIKFMNVALPTNRDPRADGAAEIRAVKVALHNSFPNVDKPVTATSDQMNNIFQQGMQPGMIVMWSGDEDKVPDGWALCDGKVAGTVITPDLRGKFIMGWNPSRSGVEAADAVNIGNKSALASHYDTDLSKYLTSEPIALTSSQIPELTVGLYGPGSPEVERKMYAGKADNGRDVNNYTNEFWGDNSEVSFKTKGTKGDAHSHKLVADADKGKFDKRPDWYALAFIMYTGVFIL